LSRSVIGMTDQQCITSSEMCGLRGGRELTTTRVARQTNTDRSWMYDWRQGVPATIASYYGALASPSLRGAKRRSDLGGEPNGIATPRLVGARNDKNAWCWTKEAATKSWRRDPQELVSSLFLGRMTKMTISTRGAFSTGRVPVGRGQLKNTSNIPGVE
jgi:hypothetical protein